MHLPSRFLLSASLLLGACASPPTLLPGPGHLGTAAPERPATAPPPALPPPTAPLFAVYDEI
ncbi:hypothetical protein, partial [Zoogloea sp.]|uniref:hypothetical protein n=1 Tax=Zoogloea sp. TaxID=49181 RepID=UPI0031FD321E